MLSPAGMLSICCLLESQKLDLAHDLPRQHQLKCRARKLVELKLVNFTLLDLALDQPQSALSQEITHLDQSLGQK